MSETLEEIVLDLKTELQDELIKKMRILYKLSPTILEKITGSNFVENQVKNLAAYILQENIRAGLRPKLVKSMIDFIEKNPDFDQY